eukprot:850810_1
MLHVDHHNKAYVMWNSKHDHASVPLKDIRRVFRGTHPQAIIHADIAAAKFQVKANPLSALLVSYFEHFQAYNGSLSTVAAVILKSGMAVQRAWELIVRIALDPHYRMYHVWQHFQLGINETYLAVVDRAMDYIRAKGSIQDLTAPLED